MEKGIVKNLSGWGKAGCPIRGRGSRPPFSPGPKSPIPLGDFPFVARPPPRGSKTTRSGPQKPHGFFRRAPLETPQKEARVVCFGVIGVFSRISVLSLGGKRSPNNSNFPPAKGRAIMLEKTGNGEFFGVTFPLTLYPPVFFFPGPLFPLFCLKFLEQSWEGINWNLYS